MYKYKKCNNKQPAAMLLINKKYRYGNCPASWLPSHVAVTLPPSTPRPDVQKASYYTCSVNGI